MRKELDEALCAKYPKIFKDRHGDKMQTCMCWGFACGDGWYQLIDWLCMALQDHTDHTSRYVDGKRIHPPQPVATQVKEKFGELRFYVNGADEAHDAMIEMAEYMSHTICEACGSLEDVKATTGWIRHLCGKCRTISCAGDGESDNE